MLEIRNDLENMIKQKLIEEMKKKDNRGVLGHDMDKIKRLQRSIFLLQNYDEKYKVGED